MPPARGAFHLTEVIQNGIGLRADGFSLAGDQAALRDFDGGDALLGDQGLDFALAKNWIGAQVAGALERAGEKFAAEGACWIAWFTELLQLQSCGFAQLCHRQGVHKPLAEHAVASIAKGVLPSLGGGVGLAGEPALLLWSQVHRTDSFRCVAAGNLLKFVELSLQSFTQALAFLAVNHLHKCARHQVAAALLEGLAVDHQGIFGGCGIKRGRYPWPQVGFGEPGPAGDKRHQQAHQQQTGLLDPQPAQQRPSGRFVAQPAVPEPAQARGAKHSRRR